MERLNLWLKSRSPLWVVGAGLVGTAIVGVIDYLLGPDAQVPILYVLVALLVSWLADTAHGVFVAAGAGVVSFVANLYPPVTSSEMLTASWNSAMNFGVLLAVCFLVSGVKKANAKRRQLERQVLEMSDQERRRIAQDLHDGLCQHLAATEFASQLLTDKLAHESLPEAADARQIVGFIQRAMTQAREIAHGLHPIEIGPGGLIASIDDLCASIREVYRIECEVQGNWIADLFGDTEATHVYRIVQEAVANAIKHGKPSRILIELCADDEGIILAVHDNGLGLPKQMQHTRGLGIGTMSYRASVIGANLTVRPNPRGGTTVLLSLPKDFQTRMRSNP
ncbi:MAG TPA: sensor histidine kinase [Verrucomicrobiae bacterium]|nr:sensor histidine kinase [Verrucomicrobiae bacterium]